MLRPVRKHTSSHDRISLPFWIGWIEMTDLNVTGKLSTDPTVAHSLQTCTFKKATATPPWFPFCIQTSGTLTIVLSLIARTDVTDMTTWIQFQI
jgi:hypothetical protein